MDSLVSYDTQLLIGILQYCEQYLVFLLCENSKENPSFPIVFAKYVKTLYIYPVLDAF